MKDSATRRRSKTMHIPFKNVVNSGPCVPTGVRQEYDPVELRRNKDSNSFGTFLTNIIENTGGKQNFRQRLHLQTEKNYNGLLRSYKLR
jgi:hypothetical protein